MAYFDLRSPLGIFVTGNGSPEIATAIGVRDGGEDARDYRDWVLSSEQLMVAPECGARACTNLVIKPEGLDDVGLIVSAEK
ncbi:hypothetical protein H6800_02285 [Candidatus Nomurabacteria bacterium]|nr:hypothetical protein [Candidatus Nomurabacteria bacterium]